MSASKSHEGTELSEINELVATVEARSADFEMFDVDIDPLTGPPGAVRFTVAPYRPMRRVQAMIRRAAYELPGIPRDRTQTRPSTPHTSIAYRSAPSPAKLIIASVREVRHLRPVATWIDTVHLVELRREDRQYR